MKRLAEVVWTSISLYVIGGSKFSDSSKIENSEYFCPSLDYSSTVTFGDPQYPGTFYNFYYVTPTPKLCGDEDYMHNNFIEPINNIAEGIANGTICGGIPALGLADKPFYGAIQAYDRDGWPCGAGFYSFVFAVGNHNSSLADNDGPTDSNITRCAISTVKPYTQPIESKIDNCIKKWGIGSAAVIGVLLIGGISWAVYKCCPPRICQKKDSKESKKGCCSSLFHRSSLKSSNDNRIPLINKNDNQSGLN